MRTILKYTAAVALTGAIALASAAPSEARYGRNAAAIGGFAAGAIVGAAAAGAASGGYYADPGYYAEPGYAPAYYDSGYYDPGYAYAPAPVYGYGYRYHNGYRPQCAIDMGYGKLDYSGC
jgi:hypothetical protein